MSHGGRQEHDGDNVRSDEDNGTARYHFDDHLMDSFLLYWYWFATVCCPLSSTPNKISRCRGECCSMQMRRFVSKKEERV
mmetsp:Transcript_14562/g.29531  ORF Transcript_14562/g.29531 Transcript_14562/m.29531 type:complete len:80 (+) Transcript_14562:1278-1517(+)